MHRVGSLWWWVGVRPSVSSRLKNEALEQALLTVNGYHDTLLHGIWSRQVIFDHSTLCISTRSQNEALEQALQFRERRITRPLQIAAIRPLFDAGGAPEPVSDNSSSPLEGFVLAVDAG